MSRVRSLQLEHVSPASLMRPEISRHARFGLVPESAVLAALRRWFWTRKPDAGFFLTDFPATLLQAQVFDEWLDTRGEILTAVLTVDSSPLSLIEYYRNFCLITKLG